MNDRIEVMDEEYLEEETVEIYAVVRTAEEVELHEDLMCAKCVGECKIY